MNISLTPELKALVEKKVASGRYQSASEVIREALRVFEREEKLRDLRMEELRRELDLGLEDLEAGRSFPVTRDTLKEIEAAGRKKLASFKNKKAA